MSFDENTRSARRAALVTGAAQGIGRAIAHRLARNGMNVACFDAPAVDASGVRADVEAHAQFLSVEGDVALAPDWRRTIECVMSAFGRLDVLVNNAGIAGPIAPLVEYPEAAFDRVMEVNARGVFLGMKYCAPELTKTAGCVVNIGSISGLGGGSLTLAYTASKHALVGMTKLAAAELAALGVRVNAVCPAPTATSMMENLARERAPQNPEKFMQAFTRSVMPMARLGEADEVANAVAFLASQEASFITGAILPVDGGAMAR